jgi:hypothetical protein
VYLTIFFGPSGISGKNNRLKTDLMFDTDPVFTGLKPIYPTSDAI